MSDYDEYDLDGTNEEEISVVKSSFDEGLDALKIYRDSIKIALDDRFTDDPDDPDLEDINDQLEVIKTIIMLFEGSANGYGAVKDGGPSDSAH